MTQHDYTVKKKTTSFAIAKINFQFLQRSFDF